MLLTNNTIYNYATQLIHAFQNNEQQLPVKINFYLQKNKKLLIALAQDIENTRIEIAQRYGKLDAETNQYIIEPDKINEASKELQDLLDLEQEVNIYKINIENITDDLTLTTGQMEAIMFMIEEA